MDQGCCLSRTAKAGSCWGWEWEGGKAGPPGSSHHCPRHCLLARPALGWFLGLGLGILGALSGSLMRWRKFRVLGEGMGRGYKSHFEFQLYPPAWGALSTPPSLTFSPLFTRC